MEGHSHVNVLIIEDDLELSSVIDRIIRCIDPSITVDWCTSAEEAIGQLAGSVDVGQRPPYQLIVSDVFLDGEKNGMDFLSYCHQHKLNLQILMMSSTERHKLFLGNVDSNYAFFIQKPFSIHECRLLIQNLLFPENKLRDS